MSIETGFINQEVYMLTKDILLWERAEGLQATGPTKRLSVKMPEQLHNRLNISAEILGNFAASFMVTEVTLTLGLNDLATSVHLSRKSKDVRDPYTEDFITVLESFDQHDHNLCLLKYAVPVGSPEPTSVLEKGVDESEKALEYWEQNHASGE